MDWSLLSISHAIIHRVFPRDKVTKAVIDPQFSEAAFLLSEEMKDMLRKRVTAAISQNSHGFEMGIESSGTDSFCHLGAEIAFGPHAGFVSYSKQLARNLNVAQSGRDLQGGALIVLRGTVGVASRPCCIVVKAELQSGLTMKYQDHAFSMELLNELLLTEAQRLYKMGILVQFEQLAKRHDSTNDPEGLRAFVFDYQMTSRETRDAAHYFSVNFLGLKQLPSARKKTQHFYEATREFIQNSMLADEEKLATHDALRVELRSNATTINPIAFAQNYLATVEMRDAYRQFLVEKEIGTNTIDKDTEYIKSKLRRPKMTFSSGVSISVPGASLGDLVRVLPPEAGQSQNVTRVEIKGRLQDQS